MTVQAHSPKTLRLAAGLVLLASANIACALEVGFLRLERQPGKPLGAEIPLQDKGPIVASELRARIAARETFEVAGLRYHPGLAKVQISAKQLPNGKAALVLEGLPGDAGALDLLLTVSDRSMLTIAEYRIQTQSMGNEFPPARAGSALAAQQRSPGSEKRAAEPGPASPPTPTAPSPAKPTAPAPTTPPAGTATPAPATVAGKPAPADPRVALTAAVQAWASAWTRRDVKAYLDAYSPTFISADKQPFEAWAAQRRARIESRKDIEVRIDALELDAKGSDWVASFTQHYRSGALRESTRKQLLMRNFGGRWLIVAEREDS